VATFPPALSCERKAESENKLPHSIRFASSIAPNETVWLSQAQMAELFQTTKQNVSLHIKDVFEEKELDEASVVKESLTTATGGKNYQTKY